MSKPLTAKICKAVKDVGKMLTFRSATVADAGFILCLHSNTEKNYFLKIVCGKLADQKAWLNRYVFSNDQTYFIIRCHGESIETIRLYDPHGDNFSWGTWILKNNRSSHVAMESVLMLYANFLDHLNFNSAHLDVCKDKERIW